jgi:hypothetical protein
MMGKAEECGMVAPGAARLACGEHHDRARHAATEARKPDLHICNHAAGSMPLPTKQYFPVIGKSAVSGLIFAS